jgi:hypothetical protein
MATVGIELGTFLYLRLVWLAYLPSIHKVPSSIPTVATDIK